MSRRSSLGRAAAVLGVASALMLVGGCTDVDDPTIETRFPPADGTQPVNSMTNDSAMVPGGELDPTVGDTVSDSVAP